jgi:dTDP-4-amino-4,6-dideoxygalactose transaminase
VNPAPIPIHSPSVGERELAAVARVFESRWLGMGQVAREFEERIAALVGARYAVAVAACCTHPPTSTCSSAPWGR